MTLPVGTTIPDVTGTLSDGSVWRSTSKTTLALCRAFRLYGRTILLTCSGYTDYSEIEQQVSHRAVAHDVDGVLPVAGASD